MVYFIRSGEYVKIGYTENAKSLHARIRNLQCGNPEELSLSGCVADAGRGTERWLHEAFSSLHARNEWFEADSDLERAMQAATSSGLDEIMASVRPQVPRPRRGRPVFQLPEAPQAFELHVRQDDGEWVSIDSVEA